MGKIVFSETKCQKFTENLTTKSIEFFQIQLQRMSGYFPQERVAICDSNSDCSDGSKEDDGCNMTIKVTVRCGLRMAISVTRKKLPNVYKSCPKMISIEK